jgi:hypothetical protein
VQQCYPLQIGLYLQVKETLVSVYEHQHPCSKFDFCHQEKGTCVAFCVQQHQFLKFLPFSQEEGTCVVFFLYQLFWLTFGFYPQVKEIVNIFVVQRHV